MITFIIKVSIMPADSLGRGIHALYARSFASEKDTTCMPAMPVTLPQNCSALFTPFFMPCMPANLSAFYLVFARIATKQRCPPAPELDS